MKLIRETRIETSIKLIVSVMQRENHKAFLSISNFIDNDGINLNDKRVIVALISPET